jgi:hypothetical protein
MCLLLKVAVSRNRVYHMDAKEIKFLRSLFYKTQKEIFMSK